MDERLLDQRVVDERVVRAVIHVRLFPLPAAGRSFYLLVVGGAAAAAIAAFGRFAPTSGDWLAFGVLAAFAALAQLFIVRTGRNHGFHTAIVFVVAAALLLPPPLIVLMAIAQHGPEWVKERYPWFIQSFNVANFALGSLAAWAAAHGVANSRLDGADVRSVVGVAVAALVFVAVNHVLLAGMLRFGRRLGLRASGLFSPESLATDLVLAGLGIALATVWRSNPGLAPAVIAPVVLSHRSFRVLGLLRDSEERFRTVFDAAPIGMVVRDVDGRLLSTNRALSQMLGYSGDELARVDPESLMPESDAARGRELHGELAEGIRDGYASEQRFTHRDGSDVFGRVDVTVVRDAGERPQFVLSMVQDVTDRKQLEEQLLQAQKMEAVGRLAGGVAHDFNNLLTAISGYADFAAERLGEREPEVGADIREITKAAGRANELTRQLLAFSRKQILQPQIVDLGAVVADLDPMLRRLIGEDIEIVTVQRSHLGRVRADPGQLHQVILNLVVNARDEMPNGGTLFIETANTIVSPADAARRGDDLAPGSFVTLTIRDTGPGMDAATKARLFEPFFTRKEVGKGTGLGLATVYGIVKQSAGFIDVQSEPGEGATFTIFLPSLGVAAMPPPVAAEAPQPAPRGFETILVVEDEDLVRRFVETVLRKSGYEVIVARDGYEALAEAAERDVDLLLTDLVMPKMNGRELSGHIDAPAVYMSGYSDGLISRHGALEPDALLIQKPFTAAELTTAVRDVLDRVGEPVVPPRTPSSATA